MKVSVTDTERRPLRVFRHGTGNQHMYRVNDTAQKEGQWHEGLPVRNRVTHSCPWERSIWSLRGESQLQSRRTNKSLTRLVWFLNKHIYIIAPTQQSDFFYFLFFCPWDLKDYLKRNRS